MYDTIKINDSYYQVNKLTHQEIDLLVATLYGSYNEAFERQLNELLSGIVFNSVKVEKPEEEVDAYFYQL